MQLVKDVVPDFVGQIDYFPQQEPAQAALRSQNFLAFGSPFATIGHRLMPMIFHSESPRLEGAIAFPQVER